jgi:septal ring factor EnvC (AmiA/AmiB activator)
MGYSLLVLLALGLLSRLRGTQAQLSTRDSEVAQLKIDIQSRDARMTEMQRTQHTVVTTVTKPDGTRTQTQTTDTSVKSEIKDVKTQTSEEASTRVEQHAATSGPAQSLYSLGLYWDPAGIAAGRDAPNSVLVGARLGGLPVWIEAGAHGSSTQARWSALIGIRGEL